MGKHYVVTFPDIGEGVVEGEVIEWLKNVGDNLKQDEPVVVVMTDKATVELPAPKPGKLAKQYFQPGQMAIKDKPLYEIELANEADALEILTQMEMQPSPPNVPPLATTTAPSAEKKQATTKRDNVSSIPKVRHLAKELEIDLDQIQGSGKDGRIILQDLHSHKTQTPLLHLPNDESIPMIGIRNQMAKKMTESKALIPHFSYFETADVTRLIQLRQSVKREAQVEGLHVTFMPFIIRALSLTLKQFPTLNSSYNVQSAELLIHHKHNIGIAMSTPRGLIVPVLKGVEAMDMPQIIHAYDQLLDLAQGSKLHSSDMKEATITVSNYGTSGHGLWATPIINYPEVGILATARIQQQPLIRNGELAIRDTMNLSWSFDHRVIDGDLAVHISDHFCKLLQNPASLL